MADTVSLRDGEAEDFQDGGNTTKERVSANSQAKSQAEKRTENKKEDVNDDDTDPANETDASSSNSESEADESVTSESNSEDSERENGRKRKRRKVARSVRSETESYRSEWDKPTGSSKSEQSSKNGHSSKNGQKTNVSRDQDGSAYMRFNPFKSNGKSVVLDKDLRPSVSNYFTNYMPDNILQETILDTAPVPENEAISAPQTDEYLYPILEELGRSAERGAEKGLLTAQKRIINTMGPLYKMWTVLESIKKQATHENARIDTLDIFQMLELVEKSMCCVGQANLAVTHHRRLTYCIKIKGDTKLGSKMLKDGQSKIHSEGKNLFGRAFERDMQKAVERREKARKLVNLLKADKKKEKKPQSGKKHFKFDRKSIRNHNEDRGRGNASNWQPFPNKPSNYNTFGGREKGTVPRKNFKKQNRYVEISSNQQVRQIPRQSDARNESSSEHASCKFSDQSKGRFKISKSKGSYEHSKSRFKSCTMPVRIGRQTKIFQIKLGKDHERSSNFANCPGSEVRIFGNTSSKTNTQSTQTVRYRGSELRLGNTRFTGKKSSRICSSKPDQIHKQYVSCTQKRWGKASSYKSESSKPVHSIQTFQNGGGPHVKRSIKTRRLHVQTGLKRCLPLCPNTRDASTVSGIQMEKSISKIQMSRIRRGICPKNIYKTPKTSCRNTKEIGSKTNNLSGRHASNGIKCSKIDRIQRHNNFSTSGPGPSNKLEKIQPRTHSKNRVFRFRDRFHKYDDLSPREQNSWHSNSMSRGSGMRQNISPPTGKTNGENGFNSPSNTPGDTSMSPVTNDASKKLTARKIIRRPDYTNTRSNSRHQLVAPSIRWLQWSRYYRSLPRFRHRVRCIKKGVGSHMRDNKNRGLLGLCGTKLPHKLSRIIGSLSRAKKLNKGPHWCSRTSQTRQYDSRSPPTQDGGDKISRFESFNKRNLAMVQKSRDLPVSRTLARSIESNSGLGIQTRGRFKRLETEKIGISTDSRHIGEMHDRSVCISSEPSTDSIYQLETGSRRLEDGCLPSTMDRSASICISPFLSDRQMSSKDSERRGYSDANCTGLAGPDLVSNDFGNVNEQTDSATNAPRPVVITNRATTSTDEYRSTSVGSLENLGNPPEMSGLSTQSAEIFAGAWRPGTRASYKSAWRKWDSWCSERHIDPIRTSIENVIDFLTSLFQAGLQYRTINTYRSAISRGHSLISGTPVGQHRLVVTHMKAIFNWRTPQPRYQFIWDVNTVLECILKWGHTNTLSDKLLTYKVTMLLALTSAGRCSELQALDIRFMKRGISHLTFTLPKMTKTCKTGCNNRTFTVHKFSIQKELCVIETIDLYLQRTKSLRNSNHKLLLSYVKPHKEVSSSTVSRWLKSVIKLSGIDSEIFKGHSTRAASTSKAFGAGLSVKDIMLTAGWSKPSTFQRFYCREIVKSNKFQQTVLHRRN